MMSSSVMDAIAVEVAERTVNLVRAICITNNKVETPKGQRKITNTGPGRETGRVRSRAELWPHFLTFPGCTDYATCPTSWVVRGSIHVSV